MSNVMEPLPSFVVFDFDGVLVDSLGVKETTFVQVFETWGNEAVSLVSLIHRNNPGWSRERKIKTCLQHPVLADQMIEVGTLLSEIDRRMATNLKDIKQIQGADKSLRLLKKLSVPTLLLSSAPCKEVRTLLKYFDWGHLFDEVLCGLESKTQPLAKWVAEVKVDVQYGRYFGDSQVDFEAASSVGVPFTLVGSPSNNDLFPAHSSEVTDLLQLQSFLEHLMERGT